jgi:hypothetical protein
MKDKQIGYKEGEVVTVIYTPQEAEDLRATLAARMKSLGFGAEAALERYKVAGLIAKLRRKP